MDRLGSIFFYIAGVGSYKPPGNRTTASSTITIVQEDHMPYKTLEDLPENVTNVLPKHAQEIYRAAFNNAWDEYKDPDERRGDASREETAHKVAWAAVKKEYEKEGDEWRRK